MIYFKQDFFNFFHELSKNNNKAWFHSQKKNYEKNVKGPFENFISIMIKEIQKIDKTLDINAKDCILRINRDTRFSPDKSPYKLYCTAFISNGGRRDKTMPGLFVRFSPERVGIMGGCYRPPKEQLEKIRKSIINHHTQFKKLINAKPFIHQFKHIKGDEIKRIPQDLKDFFKKDPIIAKKQFYFVTDEEPQFILKDTLLQNLMHYWKVAAPLNSFFLKAIDE